MKNLSTLFTIISLSLFTSCSYAQSTQERKVSDFTGIDASEGITVELTMGNDVHVMVVADESIIDDVITEVKGDDLQIYIKGNQHIRNKNITVKVTASNISRLDASSGSSITSKNLIESETLALSSSSGASLKIAYKAPHSSCKTSSGASANLKGVTKFFKGNASSGSHIKATDLKAINVTANASSGAHINIGVEDQLNADASSGGSINYYGSPKKIDANKSSGGSVNKH